MLKSAIIFGVVAFVLGLLITFFSPICAPCCAIFTGLGAGYLAGMVTKPMEPGPAAKTGAAAGAVSAIGGLIGQMIGGVINAVFMGPEQAMTVLRNLTGLPATVGNSAPDSYYYLGALGGPFCIGLFDIVLMACLGAAGGFLWIRTIGKSATKHEPVSQLFQMHSQAGESEPSSPPSNITTLVESPVPVSLGETGSGLNMFSQVIKRQETSAEGSYPTDADIRILQADKNIETLIGIATKDGDQDIRCKAIKALGEIGGSQAAAGLMALFKEPNEIIQKSAIAAFKKSFSGNVSGVQDPQKTNSARDQHHSTTMRIWDYFIVASMRNAKELIDMWYKDQTSGIMLAKFLMLFAGGLLWMIIGGIFVLTINNSDLAILTIFLLFLLIGLIAAASKGWDWFYDYRVGTIGYSIKLIAILFLAITIIGLAPIAYWTGKGIVRVLSGE